MRSRRSTNFFLHGYAAPGAGGIMMNANAFELGGDVVQEESLVRIESEWCGCRNSLRSHQPGWTQC